MRMPVREQRRAPHQQSRDKITTRLMGEMELRRWPRRSRRRQDRVTTAATLATSVSHVSAVGSAPSKLAGALMPCFRRTASCAENRHAPMLREVGRGVAGRAVAQLGGAACKGAGHKSRGLSAIEADLALLRERLLAMLRLLAVTARRGS